MGVLKHFSLALLLSATAALAETPRAPLFKTADLNLGEIAELTLTNGAKATVKLIHLNERRDMMSHAVREATVQVEVNGQPITLTSATYNLPQTIAGVQIDCPITRGYLSNTTEDHWALKKDARLRVWPADSPLIDPELFGYPLKQRWGATMTQFANEPTYVDGGDTPDRKKIYYHNDLDFGGCEGLTEVVAATDALVVSARKMTLPGLEDTPVRPRYDVVYLRDDRGWYYRYSHFQSIDDAVVPGVTVKKGQRMGVLGKEGASGGWSHLHFGIKAMQPSGRWGTEEAYAFAWQAYVHEQKPAIIAVARPHHFVRVHEPVVLDGSKSWSASGKISAFQWSCIDGVTSNAAQFTRYYDTPGTYSEILKVTDAAGHTAYDFAVVQVINLDPDPKIVPPTLHASFFPTTNIAPGQSVTFKVRTFRDEGGEVLDYGDGSLGDLVKSDGNATPLAKEGYAVVEHAFAKPGDYIVKVYHDNPRAEYAYAHLWVHVGPLQEAR